MVIVISLHLIKYSYHQACLYCSQRTELGFSSCEINVQLFFPVVIPIPFPSKRPKQEYVMRISKHYGG